MKSGVPPSALAKFGSAFPSSLGKSWHRNVPVETPEVFNYLEVVIGGTRMCKQFLRMQEVSWVDVETGKRRAMAL